MIQIHQLALTRALSTLEALKADFKIILPDGQEFGGLRVAPVILEKIVKRRVSGVAYGAFKNYFLPFLVNMKPGECVTVPCSIFEITGLRAAMTGWLTSSWGVGSSITSINRNTNTVDVLRLS